MSEAVGDQQAEPEVLNLYLRSFLKPFQHWLDDPDVVEILVNRPGEVWLERGSSDALICEAAPLITNPLLKQLAEQIARINHQGVSRAQPIMSASLLSGERVQVVGPPCSGADWAFAIRRHVLRDAQLEDFGLGQSQAETQGASAQDELARLLQDGAHHALLRQAIKARQNILICGGTSSGKTTFLSACLREIDNSERVITIEDARELRVPQPNQVNLVTAKGNMGEADISLTELLQASLRMRPDRLILGEIRGPEALTFLRAINTGHSGSLATIHANSAALALDQLVLMLAEAGINLSSEATMDYLRSVLDFVVYLEKEDGRRVMKDILPL
ncbi:MAG: P-type DNA transfer ATPase VirB11 [Pseudomonadota bacterium]